MKRFGKAWFMLFMTCLVVILLIPTTMAPAYADDEFYVVNTGDELAARMAQGGNIKLGVDITDSVNNFTVPSNKTVTLDLNGFAVDRGFGSLSINSSSISEYGTVIRVGTGASLTVNDSSEGHTGSITGGLVKGKGGGIYVEEGADLTLNNVTVTGNRAKPLSSTDLAYGAGIYAEQNTCLTLNNVTITNNATYQHSGNSGSLYVCKGSTLTMDGCTITGNTSGIVGGIMIEGCAVSIKNSTISDNTAHGGIAIMSDDDNYLPQVVLENCVISNNKTTDSSFSSSVVAGGITVRSVGGTVDLIDCTISGNTGINFGGVMIDRKSNGYPTVTISGGSIHNNNINAASYEWCSGLCVYGSSCTLTGDVQIYDNGGDLNDSMDAGVMVIADNGYLHMISGTISNNASKGVALYPELHYGGNPTFIMDGGEISDKKEGVHVRAGTFTMNDGAIGNTGSSDDAQGVVVETASNFNSGSHHIITTFIMNGGSISDMKEGVCVEGGTFTMNGGTISNTAVQDASGVYVSGGAFNLSGNVTITNTTGPGIALATETPTIGIVGALAETTSVSVSVDPAPEASTPTKVFTSGASGKVIMNNFTSYNEAYAVRLIDGEATMCLLSDVTLDGDGYTAIDAVGEHTGTFSAAAGDTIYITVPENKKITGVTVDPEYGVLETSLASYRAKSFIMPGCAVTVSSVEAEDFVVTYVAAVAVTCTNEGTIEHWEGVDKDSVTHYYTDEECLTEVERSEVYIDALGHELVHHDAQAATCTEVGWNAYDTCSRCDYTTYVEIPALGHDIIHRDAKAATCTEAGWDAHDACSRCDYTSEHQEYAALGHDLTHHDAKPVTCTAIGWDAYDTCSRCDYTTYVEIPALGHTVVTDEARPATCTVDGCTEGSHCSACGEVFAEQEVIPAFGHVWSDWTQTKAPEVGVKGTETRVCAHDPTHIETRDIPAIHRIRLLDVSTSINQDLTETFVNAKAQNKEVKTTGGTVTITFNAEMVQAYADESFDITIEITTDSIDVVGAVMMVDVTWNIEEKELRAGAITVSFPYEVPEGRTATLVGVNSDGKVRKVSSAEFKDGYVTYTLGRYMPCVITLNSLPEPEQGKLSKGMIALIIIGCVIAFIILIGIAIRSRYNR